MEPRRRGARRSSCVELGGYRPRKEVWKWGLQQEEAARKRWEELNAEQNKDQRKSSWRKPARVKPLDQLGPGRSSFACEIEAAEPPPVQSSPGPPTFDTTNMSKGELQRAEREFWQGRSHPRPAPIISTPFGGAPLPDIKRPSPIHALPQLSDTSANSPKATTLDPVGYTRNDWVDTRFSPGKSPVRGVDGAQAFEEVQRASAANSRESSPVPSPVHPPSPVRGVRVSAHFWVDTPNGFPKEGVVQRNDGNLGWLVCYPDGELDRMTLEQLAPLVEKYDQEAARKEAEAEEPAVVAPVLADDEPENLPELEPSPEPVQPACGEDQPVDLSNEPVLSPASKERKYWDEVTAVREANLEVQRAARRGSIRGFHQQEVASRAQRRSSLPEFGWERLLQSDGDAPVPKTKAVLKLAAGLGAAKSTKPTVLPTLARTNTTLGATQK